MGYSAGLSRIILSLAEDRDEESGATAVALRKKVIARAQGLRKTSVL